MNEHERRLRRMIEAANHGGGATGEYNLSLTLEYLEAALSAARDAALEEAKQAALTEGATWAYAHAQNACGEVAERIDALKSRPAERYIPEAKVRVGLASFAAVHPTMDWAATTIAETLGLDLDAAPAKDTAPACGACGRPLSEHDTGGRRIMKHDTTHPLAQYSVLCGGYVIKGDD